MTAAPFQLPAESVEIVLDLPFPPSINRLWRTVGRRVIKSKEYLDWIDQTDAHVMASKQYPKRKITGPFSIDVQLDYGYSKADGDNCSFKAILDWCQSRDVIRNDRDCREWHGRWVAALPIAGSCRVTLRSLHGEWQSLGSVASRVVKNLEKKREPHSQRSPRTGD